MNKKIAIIGGDLRLINLAEILTKDGNLVNIYGYENYGLQNSYASIEETTKNVDIIISSIPFSKDGIDIYAPYSLKPISIRKIANYINNKTFLAGAIPEKFYDLTQGKNASIVDLMQEEDLTILNTIATAEGTISEIIQNMPKNIHGSKILILGFGRVAKVLAKKLKALDGDITCAARKDRDFAWMEALGLKQTNINTLDKSLNKYDVIINTVPQTILNREKLEYVSKNGLLIDLASKPGGIDTAACEELKLKFIWALAIPGKVSPLTSAQYIKQTIYKILKKEKK